MARNVYLLEHDRAILRYIIEGHYESVIKGNNIWKQMENEKLLAPRTWQSLRNRFFKNISVDLSRPEYGLTQDELIGLRMHLHKALTNTAAGKPKKPNRCIPVSGKSDAEASGQKRTLALYTLEEDKAILKYILDSNLENYIKGNEMWICMENANICPTRSWHSLRNRFLRYIIPACTNPEYNLSDDEQKRLKKFQLQSKPSSNEQTEASREDVDSSVSIDSDSSEHEDSTSASALRSRTKSASKRIRTPSTIPTIDKDFFSLDMDSDSED